jgi:hypothetical protein
MPKGDTGEELGLDSEKLSTPTMFMEKKNTFKV